MAEWKSIRLYPNQIKYDTGNATLIKMPHTSKYDGYVFWHPSKLVREERYGGKMITFSYTNEFLFHLKKYGKGKYNSREVIHELDITVEEIESAFENNIDTYDKDEEPLVHSPEKKEPENATADDWIYQGKNKDKPYNELYDYMHLAGLTIHQMRICQPYGDDQRRGLWLFHLIEPQTWAKVVARVNGANKDLYAVFLYSLHMTTGYGKKRLVEETEKLIERYELHETDKPFICTEFIEQIGVDLEELANHEIIKYKVN